MKRCICDITCQVRIEGKAVLFNIGDTYEFEECPPTFRVIGEKVKEATTDKYIDYDEVDVRELEELEGDVEDLKAFLADRYPGIHYNKMIGWEKLLSRYIEVRENLVTTIDNTGQTKNTIVEVSNKIDELNKDDEDATNPLVEEPTVDDLDDILGE